MKTLASITLLSLVLSTPAFATCRLPNGESDDGTVGAVDMLPVCEPRAQKPSEAADPVAKYEAVLAAPAGPMDMSSASGDSLVKVVH